MAWTCTEVTFKRYWIESLLNETDFQGNIIERSRPRGRAVCWIMYAVSCETIILNLLLASCGTPVPQLLMGLMKAPQDGTVQSGRESERENVKRRLAAVKRVFKSIFKSEIACVLTLPVIGRDRALNKVHLLSLPPFLGSLLFHLPSTPNSHHLRRGRVLQLQKLVLHSTEG